jgi:hypothetical protein
MLTKKSPLTDQLYSDILWAIITYTYTWLLEPAQELDENDLKVSDLLATALSQLVDDREYVSRALPTIYSGVCLFSKLTNFWTSDMIQLKVSLCRWYVCIC